MLIVALIAALAALPAPDRCELHIPLLNPQGGVEQTLGLKYRAATLKWPHADSTIWIEDAAVRAEGKGYDAVLPGPIVLSFDLAHCADGQPWVSGGGGVGSNFSCRTPLPKDSAIVKAFPRAGLLVEATPAAGKEGVEVIEVYDASGGFLGMWFPRPDKVPGNHWRYWRVAGDAVPLETIVEVLGTECR